MVCSMSNDFYNEDVLLGYSNKLDVEGLLLTHMNRIAIYREKNKTQYCSSIETHILNCPKKIRTLGFKKLKDLGLERGDYTAITREKFILYDDLYVYVNELLEKNHMIWKQKQVKTFE